jgi:uncharacterized protein involved in exopolysaccharide biosynthesis
LSRTHGMLYPRFGRNESVARNVAVARAKVQSLEAAVKAESTQSQGVSVAGAQQNQLKRQVYTAFLAQAEQLRTAAEESASAHILFQSVPPQQPVATHGALSLIIGFLSGVFVAAGTLVLRDGSWNKDPHYCCVCNQSITRQ